MKPFLLTDNVGQPVLIDADSIVSAVTVDWAQYPNAHTWLRFQNTSDVCVQEPPEKIYKELLG